MRNREGELITYKDTAPIPCGRPLTDGAFCAETAMCRHCMRILEQELRIDEAQCEYPHRPVVDVVDEAVRRFEESHGVARMVFDITGRSYRAHLAEAYARTRGHKCALLHFSYAANGSYVAFLRIGEPSEEEVRRDSEAKAKRTGSGKTWTQEVHVIDSAHYNNGGKTELLEIVKRFLVNGSSSSELVLTGSEGIAQAFSRVCAQSGYPHIVTFAVHTGVLGHGERGWRLTFRRNS